MLAELHASLAVEPYRLRYPADRALPDIAGHMATPGVSMAPGQWDRGDLLRLHKKICKEKKNRLKNVQADQCADSKEQDDQ